MAPTCFWTAGSAGGVKEGPRRRRGCLEAAEHPATLNEQVDRQAQPATACGSSCSISALEVGREVWVVEVRVLAGELRVGGWIGRWWRLLSRFAYRVDPGGGRHAEPRHPVEHIAPDFRLGLLIGQSSAGDLHLGQKAHLRENCTVRNVEHRQNSYDFARERPDLVRVRHKMAVYCVQSWVQPVNGRDAASRPAYCTQQTGVQGGGSHCVQYKPSRPTIAFEPELGP